MYEIFFYSIIFTLSLVFYLFIPGIGAILSINKWRTFRKHLLDYTKLPIIDYSLLNELKNKPSKAFRFFGKLEALEGKKSIWVKNKLLTLQVEIDKSRIYLMPSHKSDNNQSEEIHLDQENSQTKWQKIYSMSEGTQVFIAGTCKNIGGQGIFYDTPEKPLITIFYNGNNHELLKNVLYGARQKNEYWNNLTPFSLIFGFLSHLILAYFLISSTPYRFFALYSLGMGLLPVTLILPPGILLFWIFQSFWNRSRIYRTKRDLCRHPSTYFDQNTDWNSMENLECHLPDGHHYLAIRLHNEKAADHLFTGSPEIIDSESSKNPEFLLGQPVQIGPYTKLKLPDDPMVPFVLFKGNPEENINSYHSKSQLYALWGIISIIADVFLNLVIIFFILRLFFQ
ncbi:MAG: hypothetical protein JXR70_11120 [Spirochaetales bacterium]|nr:hypothetical protein [Spirochaetales bacterium]